MTTPLRSIVKELDVLRDKDEAVMRMEIATGVPFVYEIPAGDGAQPVDAVGGELRSGVEPEGHRDGLRVVVDRTG